jgi:hypothetical protein
MDPWLEAPHVWPSFHELLIVKTVEVLQPQLRARGYYVDCGERVWLTEPRRPVYPDNVVFEVYRRRSSGPEAAVAVLEADEPIRVRHADVEVHEGYVEIYDAGDHHLVTGIEFLSPTNKSDKQGRELYQRKQQDVRETGVHLVEIDLLRAGPHVLDVPQDIVAPMRPWDYLVNLVRRGTQGYEVYPVRLRNRLPRVRIPLKVGDSDAVLDLQEVFDRSYEIGPYPVRLNYQGAPMPPLSEADAAWADELLRTNGLRE